MPSFDKDELKQRLTAEQFRVTQEKGTEAPFTGEYDHVFTPGTYDCVVCGHELFISDNKYDSGCGWPAFDQAQKGAVAEHADDSHGMRRTEVTCSNCGAHLGHVFTDGPRETTGMRYCINSASLHLKPKAE
jgi:peptide-methionine (R)-S-oxide reductase